MFGSTIGLIFSGVLLDLTNFRWNFFCILFIHLINNLYIISYVKKVIEIKEPIISWKNFYRTFFVWKDIRDSVQTLFKPREFNQRKYLLLALLGLLLSM